MKIAIYGGSFNPPHRGHIEAARTVIRELNPDKLLIIPDNLPPHKQLAEGSPSPEERLELCRLAFSGVEGAEVSELELRRQGKSYTFDTVRELKELYPGDELILIIGTDMFLTFEQWYKFTFLLNNCTLAVLARADGDEPEILRQAERFRDEYSAKVIILTHEPVAISSADVRELLPRRLGSDMLDDGEYACIIKNRFYEAQPELTWLRSQVIDYLSSDRVAHTAGCESEAVMLARRWGEDEETAAEAGILHDITKRLRKNEQLILCEKYGIICDIGEMENPKLLHAKTGAALAKDVFGAGPEVENAIRFHTTAKPDMSLLEKIIYLADYIEPTRDFPGVEELRELAYEDIDAAMALGLKMSLADIRSHGVEPYKDSVDACRWYGGSENDN